MGSQHRACERHAFPRASRKRSFKSGNQMVCIIKGWFSKANLLFFLPFNTHLGERWTSTLESISLRSSVFIPNLCSKAGHLTSAVFTVFMRRESNMSPAAQGCHFCPQEESCISEMGNWSYWHLKLDCQREHPNCCINSLNICCVPIIPPHPPWMLSVKCPAIAPHCPFWEDNRMYWKEGTSLSLTTE